MKIEKKVRKNSIGRNSQLNFYLERLQKTPANKKAIIFWRMAKIFEFDYGKYAAAAPNISVWHSNTECCNP